MKQLLQIIFLQFCSFLGVVSHSQASIPFTITSVFSFIIQIALCLTQIYYRFILLVDMVTSEEVSFMTKIFYYLDQCLNIFSNVSSLLLYHWRHKKMVKWNDKSCRLSSILMVESHNIMNNNRLQSLILLSFFIYPGLLYMNVISFYGLESKILQVIVDTYMLMVSFCYAGVVLNVLDQYRALNKLIVERLVLGTQGGQHVLTSAKKGRPSDTTKQQHFSAQTMRQIHFGLGECARQVPWIFSDQLVVVLSNFVRGTIVAIYFYFMDRVIRDVPTQDFLTGTMMFSLRICFHLSMLSALLLPSSLVSKESQETTKIVSRLLGRELNEEVRDQLEIFMIQQLHYQAEFKVFDIIKLDIPVIQSMAKIIITYLVILLQFEIALRISEESGIPEQ